MLIRRLWPSLVWAIAILILTGLPGKYFPTVLSFWDWLNPDKVVHVFIFGVQTVLLLYAFRAQFLLRKLRWLYGVLILSLTTLFALLTEILQKYVFIGRHGNAYDFLADLLGVIIGFLAYYLLIIKKKETGN